MCYLGRTHQAAMVARLDSSLLWETSFSVIAETWLRATDYCRLGRNDGFPTLSLLAQFTRDEELTLMFASSHFRRYSL